MLNTLALEIWRSRLECSSHRLTEPAEGDVAGFRLWPNPDIGITVAFYEDVTLKIPYRQRFFLCEAEPEPVFRAMGCPEPHRARWLELLSQQRPGYWWDFLAGPGAWLLTRLTRFREVVAWSNRGLPWDMLAGPCSRDYGLVVPTEASPFFEPTDGPEASQPRLLEVQDERFADAVTACVLFASVYMQDCYLASVDAAEVYLAHHHDKIVISIPDPVIRGQVLQEIIEAPWLFDDVSGFASSMDDDDDPDE